jgi:hypothetical protein
MNRARIRTILMVAALVVGSLTLAGCGKSMSGKYANDMMEVEFKGSKAYVTMGVEGVSRVTTEVKYEVQGDKIILHNQAGNLVLTRNNDGSLSGAPMEAMSGPLKKQ